jgi:hypothetical protein
MPKLKGPKRPLPEEESAKIPAESPAQAVAEESPEIEIESSSEDTRDVCTIDAQLNDFILQEKLDAQGYRASLYQFDKFNKNRQVLLDTSLGNILSPHEVGIAHGSGDYRYVVTWLHAGDNGKPKIKTFRFSLGPSYDAKKLLFQSANALPAEGTGAIDKSMAIVQQLLLLARAMHGPGNGSAAPPQAQSTDPVLTMANTHIAMQQLLQQSSMQYVEFMREMRKRMLQITREDIDFDTGEEEEQDQADDLIKTLKELAVQFIPKLLGDGIGAKATATAIRSMPQFKKIVNNGPKLSHLLNELEKEFGREKIDAACARLKIRRPAPK